MHRQKNGKVQMLNVELIDAQLTRRFGGVAVRRVSPLGIPIIHDQGIYTWIHIVYNEP